ncbi:MAG TPA: hypothetical protein VFW40_03565 [Capsulimonadaceae bacterium]|nr:hypothetical protein [Capsulimonadaceae bacterium]
MPRGASAKREKEYEELKDKFEEEGRYKGREEEVAARIVNKQRKEYSETKEERKEDKEGNSPDRNLPIGNYDHLTEDEIDHKLGSLSRDDLKTIRRYEESHKDRKGVLEAVDQKLA